jgi:N-acetylglucosaminyl-diphospho-decaprenol L-rhamnosyltransferase
MSVNVIVVSYNGRDLLRECLQSIEAARAGGVDLHLIVVDNASEDGSPAMVRDEFPAATLLALDSNIGFGPGNNRGLSAGEAESVLFLNPDATLHEGALGVLLQFVKDSARCVAVGPRLENPDGTFQRSCRRFPSFLRNLWNLTGCEARYPNRHPSLRNWLTEKEHVHGAQVDMISGACFLARRSFLEEVGGFDENLFMYEEEPDLFLPARRLGHEVRYCAAAVVTHVHGYSAEGEERSGFTRQHAYRSKYYMYRKRFGAIYALAVYLSDLSVFGVSAMLAKLRGKTSEAGKRFANSRAAWREARSLRQAD